MKRVLFVGDTHGQANYWATDVETYARITNVDWIIQVGDFGWWPDSRFLDVAASTSIPVWFIEGNHDHHWNLQDTVTKARTAQGIEDPLAPVPLRGSLTWLPRGSRAEIDGVRVAFLGGAVSVDRRLQTPGQTWFREEAITTGDLVRLAAGGPADLLVTHDAPSGYVVPGMIPYEDMSSWWLTELDATEAHRRMIDSALEATRPSLLIHGHYHSRYTAFRPVPYGLVRVEGLNRERSGIENFLVVTFDSGKISLDGKVVSSQ